MQAAAAVFGLLDGLSLQQLDDALDELNGQILRLEAQVDDLRLRKLQVRQLRELRASFITPADKVLAPPRPTLPAPPPVVATAEPAPPVTPTPPVVVEEARPAESLPDPEPVPRENVIRTAIISYLGSETEYKSVTQIVKAVQAAPQSIRTHLANNRDRFKCSRDGLFWQLTSFVDPPYTPRRGSRVRGQLKQDALTYLRGQTDYVSLRTLAAELRCQSGYLATMLTGNRDEFQRHPDGANQWQVKGFQPPVKIQSAVDQLAALEEPPAPTVPVSPDEQAARDARRLLIEEMRSYMQAKGAYVLSTDIARALAEQTPTIEAALNARKDVFQRFGEDRWQLRSFNPLSNPKLIPLPVAS